MIRTFNPLRFVEDLSKSFGTYFVRLGEFVNVNGSGKYYYNEGRLVTCRGYFPLEKVALNYLELKNLGHIFLEKGRKFNKSYSLADILIKGGVLEEDSPIRMKIVYEGERLKVREWKKVNSVWVPIKTRFPWREYWI